MIGFNWKWQKLHSKNGLNKIEVFLCGHRNTPLCSWLVSCFLSWETQPFLWLGSIVHGFDLLSKMAASVCQTVGQEERKKRQNALVYYLPKKVPSWKPSHGTLHFMPLDRTWLHCFFQMQGSVGNASSTLDDHMPRQIQGLIIMAGGEDGC